jgi:hypothetical protein
MFVKAAVPMRIMRMSVGDWVGVGAVCGRSARVRRGLWGMYLVRYAIEYGGQAFDGGIVVGSLWADCQLLWRYGREAQVGGGQTVYVDVVISLCVQRFFGSEVEWLG